MRDLIADLARYWADCLRWAESHCWECDRPRDYDREPQCPHCGADTTPF